jgi:hypothetical protein
MPRHATGDPTDPKPSLPPCTHAGRRHPNDNDYRTMANAIDLSICTT